MPPWAGNHAARGTAEAGRAQGKRGTSGGMRGDVVLKLTTEGGSFKETPGGCWGRKKEKPRIFLHPIRSLMFTCYLTPTSILINVSVYCYAKSLTESKSVSSKAP